MASARVSLTSALDFCNALGASANFSVGVGKLQLRVVAQSRGQMVAALFQLASEVQGATHRVEGAIVLFQFPPDSGSLARLVCTLVPFATTALQAAASRKRRRPDEQGDLGPLLAYHGVAESQHDDKPFYEYSSTSSTAPEMYKLHSIFKALRFRYNGSTRSWVRNTRLGAVPEDEGLIIALREMMAGQLSVSKLTPGQPHPVLQAAGLIMDSRGVLSLASGGDGEQHQGLPASQESTSQPSTPLPAAAAAAGSSAQSTAPPAPPAEAQAIQSPAAGAAASFAQSPASRGERFASAATPPRPMPRGRRTVKNQRTTSL